MRKLLMIYCFTFYTAQLFSQEYKPSPAIQESQQKFLDNKFGLFIHWGLYSILGNGEWVRSNRSIPEKEYDRLIDQFNPYKFDAKSWVRLAKQTGMKYITFVSRHHDGFSMFDTKFSDFNIMNTPYRKDILKELATACREEGIKLHLYYSILDWKHPDYHFETGKTGKGFERYQSGNWNNYITFMKNQLTELLTNYGEIGAIWLDGHWDQLDNDYNKELKPKVDWKYDEIYSLIHKLQPSCMIANNHHLNPLPGEDFQIFEKDLPGGNSTGFGGQKVSKLPLEMCETMNTSWGYNITDTAWKSVYQLKKLFLQSLANGSNMLLNVGPLATGEIQEQIIERLEGLGQWVNQYAEAIYGTRAVNYPVNDEFVLLKKNNKVFVHFIEPPLKKFVLYVPYQLKTIKNLRNQKMVKFDKIEKDYYLLHIDDQETAVLELQL